MNDVYLQHIKKLGFRAVDKVTGFKGVIDSVGFDAYGCIQFVLKPLIDKNGECPAGVWFDVTRLEIDESERVIALPNFEAGYVAEGRKGAADKPMQRG